MKTLLLALFISTSAFAQNEAPIGVYRLDTVHSRTVSFDKTTKLNGSLELSDEFSQSKLSIESGDISFESTEFIGTIENFEVKGILTTHGVTSRETLKGRYFGKTHNDFGDKTLFNFFNKDINFKIFASKPSLNTTAIFKVVQDIIYDD